MTTKNAIIVTLRQIGKNGFDGITCPSSPLPHALREHGLNNLSSTTLTRVAAELRRQQLIEITHHDVSMTVRLSVHGIHRLQRAHIDTITIPEPAKWDGIWRLITYDIPRTKATQRRLLVRQLTRLGFVMVRESVWLHPFPCFDAVNELLHYTGLDRYTTRAEVVRLDTITRRIVLDKQHTNKHVSWRIPSTTTAPSV